MQTIDRADWHYENDFPIGIPIENGGTHIGMYLAWIINNGLIGKLHLENSLEGVESVKQRKITGRDFLMNYCDEKFWEEDLNEEGLIFTKYYYQNPDNPNDVYGQYLIDYESSLGIDYESLYEIPDTFDNYDKIAKIIDVRYQIWKRDGIKNRWKFWKK